RLEITKNREPNYLRNASNCEMLAYTLVTLALFI
ncbi:MAG: hypothetical protein ACI9FG_001017, partial [Crocinitomicaceae bacterium]